jgi:ABC-type polysaccharide/polyol phosphate transport system ATPase subunit
MNNKPRIPNAEVRARSVKNMQEVNRQFDLAILLLDEAIAIMDRELLTQRRARLERRTKTSIAVQGSDTEIL